MFNQKNILTLLTVVCSSFIIHAQDLTKLSYAEIDSLMYIEYNKGAFDKAIPLMQAGRDKAKIDFGEQDSVFLEYTGNLGFFYKNMGNYEKALPLHIQAKNIREKALGVEHPDFAHSLTSLAGLHEDMGNYEKSLPLYIQAKNIREKALGVEHPDFAASLNNLAKLHYAMGNYEKSLPLFIQAKNIYEKVLGLEHPAFALSLNNLAALHRNMGNYKNALPLFIQAKNIREKVLGLEHPDFATSLNNLAFLHQDMGNYKKALPLMIQSKNIYEKVWGLEHPAFALSLNNLAGLHQYMGNYKKALPLMIQSKNIREKVLGLEHPEFATSLNNLAFLHYDMGNYEKAWVALLQAIEVASSLKPSQNISQTWADSLLRAPYSSNLPLEIMTTSLKLAYDLLDEQSELRKLGPEDQRNDNDTSITASKEKQIIVSNLAAALLVQLRDKLGNEEDKLRMLSQSSDWLLKSLKVLDKNKDADKAFEKAEQNKSVLLLEAAKSEKAYQLGNLPDSLVRQEQGLIKKRDKLQAKLLEKRPKAEKDSLRSVLISVHQDLNDFVAKIERDYPKYAAFKYKNVDVKAVEIQKLLDSKTALLEYVIGDSVLYIFYLDKKQLHITEQAIGNEKLTQEIKQLHEALSNYSALVKKPEETYKSYTSAAHWCYQNLVAPVLQHAKGMEQFIIVTDGELGHLPFEAFLVEAAPAAKSSYADLHYLLQDYKISYNYSATLWKENKEAAKPKNNGQILGIAANYAMKADSAISLQRSAYNNLRDALSPLPAAREEVELLSKKFKGLFAFDSLASERFFKEKAGEYAVIHLAMHGLLNNRSPILSSLAFTEDSDSVENNFLQAYEISKMELNADLVVLSACETGFGKFEKGNGIASLARAFMYAGAPALVVSLWQVNDHATALLMEQFYDNLAKGMDKAEALQQAKLVYIAEAGGIAAHPAFWSPFILMGDTAPITVATKGPSSLLWWAVGSGAGLLLLGGFAWSRRKRAEA